MNVLRLSIAALLLAPAIAFAAWPEIPAPRGARVESIGEHVRLNGIPMRMHRVLAGQRPEAVLAFYRDTLGTRHAEQRLSDGHILSQERGDYFITVRIKALAANLTEVLVSASDMLEAKRAANRPLGFNLPAESEVLSDMESTDAGKRSRQLVINNSHTLPANLQSFTRELAARGLRPDGPPLRQTEAEHAQLFKGDQGEAQLTLMRKNGQTSIVLTTINNP
jgi:hypothetical protein